MGLSSAMNTILIILMVFVVLVSVINFRKINIVNKKVNRVKRRYDALFRAQDGDIEDILNQNSTDIVANQNRRIVQNIGICGNFTSNITSKNRTC